METSKDESIANTSDSDKTGKSGKFFPEAFYPDRHWMYPGLNIREGRKGMGRKPESAGKRGDPQWNLISGFWEPGAFEASTSGHSISSYLSEACRDRSFPVSPSCIFLLQDLFRRQNLKCKRLNRSESRNA